MQSMQEIKAFMGVPYFIRRMVRKWARHHSRVFLLLLMILSLCGCTHDTFHTKQELLNYLQEETNGYSFHKTINGVDYSLVYRPTDVMVAQELGNDSSEARIAALRKKYAAYMYFNLSMSKNDKELLSSVPIDKHAFGAMVNQLAFGMDKKVHFYTQHKDTIALVDFIYPRMYGMSNATTLMLIYPRDKIIQNDETFTLSIADLGLHTGSVKFKIATEKLVNEPQLLWE